MQTIKINSLSESERAFIKKFRQLDKSKQQELIKKILGSDQKQKKHK